MERYFVSLRIQDECGKIRTRKTRNIDTFYAVVITPLMHMVHSGIVPFTISIPPENFQKPDCGRTLSENQRYLFADVLQNWCFWQISQYLQENTCLAVSYRPLRGESNTSDFLWILRNILIAVFLQSTFRGWKCTLF